jgi:uncharacterized protein (DUF1015 family)
MPQIAGFRGVMVDPKKPPSPRELKDRLGKGELAPDATRTLYRYHQVFAHPDDGRTFTRKALIAAVKLDTTEHRIHLHEVTDAAAREAATAQLAATGVELEPVLAGYRDAAGELDRLFRRIEAGKPDVELTTPDGVAHRLWRETSAELFGKLRPVFAPKKLVVLDGHDRHEAMVAYRDKLDAASPLSMYSSGGYGLYCLVNLDDPALVARARHRVLRGNLDKQALLAAAKTHYVVEKLPGIAADPAKLRGALAETIAHQPAFALVFAGDTDAWKLTLSPEVSPVAEGVAVHRGLQKYDAIVVDGLFLPRLAKDATATTETSIAGALAALAAGAAAVVLMRPPTIEQIQHVADLNQLLPTRSTAFHPPIASLVGYVVDPEQDLV